MRNTYYAPLALLFILAACATPPPPVVQSTTAEKQELSKGDLPATHRNLKFPEFIYSPPDPETYRVELRQGAVAYLVPDSRLPLVQFAMYFQESSFPVRPEEKAALSLLSTMYRRGGSLQITPTALEDSLEFLAASLVGGLGDFRSHITFNSLSRDLPTVLGLMENVFLQPAFDSAMVELQKVALRQSLLHKHDRPADMLADLFQMVSYNPHPLLYTSRIPEVEGLRRSHLIPLAQGRFSPDRVVFAVSGDFDRDYMAAVLDALIMRWPKVQARSAPPPPQFRNKPGIYLSHKPISQAHIRMGQPFVQRPHPDYYATAVASYILGGGGFTSRLTSRVRSDEGLAYSVFSFAQSSYDFPGMTGVALQTKVSSAARAVSIVFEEIRNLASRGPTPEEMQGAIKSIVESLPGMFDTPHAVADAFAQSELWGRELDHFRKFPQHVRAVTAQDVQRVLELYFRPEAMTIAIVGPVEELQKKSEGVELSALGPIHIIPADSLEIR